MFLCYGACFPLLFDQLHKLLICEQTVLAKLLIIPDLHSFDKIVHILLGYLKRCFLVIYCLCILQFDPFIKMRALSVSPDNDGHGAGEHAEWRAPRMTGALIN